MASTKTETATQSKVDEYFQQNEKFFNSGDTNAKKPFSCSGNITEKLLSMRKNRSLRTARRASFKQGWHVKYLTI